MNKIILIFSLVLVLIMATALIYQLSTTAKTQYDKFLVAISVCGVGMIVHSIYTIFTS